MLQRLKSINFSNYLSQEPTSDFSEKTPKSNTHYPPEQIHEQDQPQIEEEEKEVMEEKQQIQEEEQTLDEVCTKPKEAESRGPNPTPNSHPVKYPQNYLGRWRNRQAQSHCEEDDVIEVAFLFLFLPFALIAFCFVFGEIKGAMSSKE
ncbi:hypothetical protein SLE2022_051850 [Rubroshorea leprosula]